MRSLVILLPLLLIGCSTSDRRYPDYGRGPGYPGYSYGYGRGEPEIGAGEIGDGHRHDRGRYDSYEIAPPVLEIPRGHLPPPGLCRVWFPGRPPGQQPPPADCEYLERRVPPGAWLLSVRDRDHVQVSVFDSRRPGYVVDRGIYFRDGHRLIREDGRRR